MPARTPPPSWPLLRPPSHCHSWVGSQLFPNRPKLGSGWEANGNQLGRVGSPMGTTSQPWDTLWHHGNTCSQTWDSFGNVWEVGWDVLGCCWEAVGSRLGRTQTWEIWSWDVPNRLGTGWEPFGTWLGITKKMGTTACTLAAFHLFQPTVQATCMLYVGCLST